MKESTAKSRTIFEIPLNDIASADSCLKHEYRLAVDLVSKIDEKVRKWFDYTYEKIVVEEEEEVEEKEEEEETAEEVTLCLSRFWRRRTPFHHSY